MYISISWGIASIEAEEALNCLPAFCRPFEYSLRLAADCTTIHGRDIDTIPYEVLESW